MVFHVCFGLIFAKPNLADASKNRPTPPPGPARDVEETRPRAAPELTACSPMKTSLPVTAFFAASLLGVLAAAACGGSTDGSTIGTCQLTQFGVKICRKPGGGGGGN